MKAKIATKREKIDSRIRLSFCMFIVFSVAHTSMCDCGSEVELSDNFHVPSVCHKLKLLLPDFFPSNFLKFIFMLIFVPFIQWEKFRDFSLIVINSRKDFFLFFALHSVRDAVCECARWCVCVYVCTCICVHFARSVRLPCLSFGP